MIIEQARRKIIDIAEEYKLLDEEIKITCRTLTPEEAIGNPLHNDYPIQKGKERMVEAEFMGKKGQAFSDSCSNFTATLRDVFEMELDSNAKRAIFISSVNSILAMLEMIPEAIHCKDEEPVTCSDCFLDFLNNENPGNDKALLVGLQPRLLEKLAKVKEVRVCDLDPDNIGATKCGVVIDGPEKFKENADWADAIFATGSTIVNGTIDEIVEANPDTCFFGVTISGVAKLLGLKQFCYILGEE
ncbi:MAG TPA: DUF364 domain-containing protein [Spirochaetota bacterium]|nr:DUF364 domain-containing protein [Spirochaetota bacterium]HPJ34300.1 DUF364 domain-containing protein [Spirochaetota bacterium]